jgi:hypothetical protein
VAFEDDYRVYREVIASSIRLLRPHVEVVTSGLDALEEEVARLDPNVVIGGRPPGSGIGDRVAWMELSFDVSRPTVILMGGRYSELNNPGLQAILGFVDEAERLLRES